MPSENVGASIDLDGPPHEPVDRRARKRSARRDHLLDLADDLVAQHGVDGVTMAALAQAADYAPASLYTYFPSRSALLAALQQRALRTLARVARERLGGWIAPVDARTLSLARLWAFSDLFLAAPREHAREFRLQQQLLVSADAEETGDAATVVPAAMAVLDVPRGLLADAVDQGALSPHPDALDPLGQPVDGHLVRTLAWMSALNGALLVDALATGLPTTGVALGGELTGSLLLGWGADTARSAAARGLAATWRPTDVTWPTDTTGRK